MIGQIFTAKNALLGFGTWAIPFFAAFAFVGSGGEMRIDETFFKSIMIVVGALAGAWLLARAFRTVSPGFASGLVLGLFWLVINWAFDYATLVTVMGQDMLTWFTTIGLRYLMIPIMATAMGAMGARAGE